MVLQGAQYLLNVLQIFFLGSIMMRMSFKYKTKNTNCEWSYNAIHHPHERFWSISQAKGHDQPLKKAFFISYGFLPYIGFLNCNMVVAWLHINFTKELGTINFIHKIINKRDWASILDNDFVQFSIINVESPYHILLLHQQKWALTRWGV